MFGLNPYSLAAKALILIGLYLAGCWSGWRVESWHRDSMEVAAVKKAQAERDAEALRASDAAKQLEAARALAATQQQAITKTVDRIVVRPVYTHVCLDADGVRILNAAIAGKAPDPAGPPAGLSTAQPAGRRDSGKPPKVGS